jgi:uncharacterized membrane protein YfcA
VGGAINALAGGGSFVAFPTLLFVGVPPVPANATNCLALFVGTTASGGAYRSRLAVRDPLTFFLVLTSVLGGLLGAFLLIRTPRATFVRLLPWLMLVATLLFAGGPHLGKLLGGGPRRDPGAGAVLGACLFQAVVAIYGGYFGGGIGIMILAMLSVLGRNDLQAMNAFKVLLVGIINGVASVTFVVTGAVWWPQALAMTGGAILGGYTAARHHDRLPPLFVRGFVILAGLSMTVVFFLRRF